jgi:ribosomal peptide maturation radical SAM protein 1
MIAHYDAAAASAFLSGKCSRTQCISTELMNECSFVSNRPEDQMCKVTLINPPFANVRLPSIALTQLKSAVEQRFGNDVSVRIINLNHDFALYLGEDIYDEIALHGAHHNTGLGDWLFREVAFPDVPDNADDYLARYYPQRDAKTKEFRRIILEKRRGIRVVFTAAIDRYGVSDANIVGLTSMFSQNTASFALANIIKSANPQVIIVMGGANCEYPMGREIIQNARMIDYVFSGPALLSFPDFVGYNLGVAAPDNYHSIDGLFSRMNTTVVNSGETGTLGESGLIAVAPNGREQDINVTVALDYTEFLESFERKFPNATSMLSFETSRGCWWGEKSHCTFCGLNGSSMIYRSMKPELALAQFRSLFQYSDRCSHLQCVDNILPRSYLSDVLPYVNTPQNMSLFYEVKADLSEKDVRTLADARVTSIQPGIEALASSTLKLMRKGTTAFQNVSLLKYCRKYDVEPVWNLLVGFPGEHSAVYEKYVRDIPLLVHLQPPSGAFPVRFDRFSPYFVAAESYGLELEPCDYYEMTYPFLSSSLKNLAYYFMDQNYEADYFVNLVDWLDPIRSEVGKWTARWSGGETDRPRLEFDVVRQNVVVDTRGTRPIEHKLSDLGSQLLCNLEVQAPIERLCTSLDGVSPEAVAHEIRYLQERGLLFEENGRVLSLVLNRRSEICASSAS